MFKNILNALEGNEADVVQPQNSQTDIKKVKFEKQKNNKLKNEPSKSSSSSGDSASSSSEEESVSIVKNNDQLKILQDENNSLKEEVEKVKGLLKQLSMNLAKTSI